MNSNVRVDAQTGHQGPVSPVVEQLLMHEREMADEIQAHEREEEDRARVEKRVQKQLITDARLALDGESTDSNLLEERVHADLELITRDQFVSIVSHDLKEGNNKLRRSLVSCSYRNEGTALSDL